MIGTGFLNRVARIMASSWVLSPISAMATTRVETSRDSIWIKTFRAGRMPIASTSHPAREDIGAIGLAMEADDRFPPRAMDQKIQVC
jgi:hypothetical protein